MQQKELNLEKARTDLYLEAAITRLNTMAAKEHEEAIRDIEKVHEQEKREIVSKNAE